MTWKVNLWSFLVLGIFTLSLFGEETPQDLELPSVSPFSSQLDVSYSFGKFIAIHKNYGKVGLVVAHAINAQFTSLVDLRGYWIDNRSFAESIGTAIRYKASSSKIAWGGNVFFDGLRWKKGSFSQIGLGFEALSDHWDFRFNAYLPLVSERIRQVEHYNNFIGDFHATRRQYACHLKGANAEVGVKNHYYDNRLLIYTAIGPYYYTHAKIHHFLGCQGRIQVSLNNLLSFEVLGSYDDRFKTCFQGKVSLSFPLDSLWTLFKSPCTCSRDLYLEPIRRNDLILLDKACCWKWNW